MNLSRLRRFLGLADAPAHTPAAVTPDDNTDFDFLVRRVYVGGAGDITGRVHGNAGTPVTLTSVPAGTMLDVAFSRIHATGTTATNMIAFQ